MKPTIHFGLAIGALAITLASPAMAGPGYGGGGGYYGPRCWTAPDPSGFRRRIECPENGFGSRTPVTLPPDRQIPKGTDTGIPVRGGTGGPVLQPTRYPIQQHYFRPR